MPVESPSGTATVLGAGTRIVGELDSSEDLVLAGAFEGTLRVQRALRIMPEANVQGEIDAERVLVLGRVQGRLHARERVEIRTGAVVSGDIVAPDIRVHEGVVLNANVRMSGPPAPPRQYLVPALLRSYDKVPSEKLEAAERAAEGFLRSHGFELETRAKRPDRSGTLRPIFRSREPLPYDELKRQLEQVELALQSAVSTADGSLHPQATGLQGTGTSGARELAQALAGMRRAAWAVGPVAVTRFEENPGTMHLAVHVRRGSMPQQPKPGDAPDPAHLLTSLQKVQHELLDDLGSL
jgi:cytoskeletal protein CcmA (bactofilin family)